MYLRIETLAEKKLMGMRKRMSFARATTSELWQRFMPARHTITNRIGTDLYSLEIYPPSFFDDVHAHTEFEKWAAVEVADWHTVPPDMETLMLPSGLYAFFLHRGTAAEGAKTYQFIFNSWLPASGFAVDDRPHFAVMGARYKHNDPESEEEIAIPVRPK